MTVIGYAKQQGSPTAPAKWVARCSCGNHEYRTRILRWVSTKAPDSCRECRHRDYILSKGKEERDPAVRLTIIAAKQGAQW